MALLIDLYEIGFILEIIGLIFILIALIAGIAFSSMWFIGYIGFCIWLLGVIIKHIGKFNG